MIATKESGVGFPSVFARATIGHATGITFDVTATDRIRLEAIVAKRGSPQKHAWRAKIILMSDDGVGTVAIMEATGKSKSCVGRWQERFMAEGVDGLLLLRYKSRPPGIAPLDPALVDQVIALTLETPKQGATHWTVRAMAKAVGIPRRRLAFLKGPVSVIFPEPLEAFAILIAGRAVATTERALPLARGDCQRQRCSL